MRKSLMFISIMALTACSTGGGGSNDVNNPRHSVTQAAMASNKNITNMTSEILVPKDGVGNPIVRGAHIPHYTRYNGKDYISYKLDDIKFNLASGEGGEDAYFQFVLDRDGRIDKVNAQIGGPLVNGIVRDADTNGFNGAIFEYIVDGKSVLRVLDDGQITMEQLNAKLETENLSGGQWNRIDQLWIFDKQSANDGENRLTYADFGYFMPVNKQKNKALSTQEELDLARLGDGALNRPDNPNCIDCDFYEENLDAAKAAALANADYQMYAGGYAILNGERIATLSPTDGMSFTGKAIGKIDASVGADHNKDVYTARYNLTDDNSSLAHTLETADGAATLTFANGTETLYMPFSNNGWYDVTVTKTGDNATIAFVEDTDSNDMLTEHNGLFVMHDTTPDGFNENGVVHMGYYGIDTPSEAAGTIGWHEQFGLTPELGEEHANDNPTLEHEFQAAYGMTKD